MTTAGGKGAPRYKEYDFVAHRTPHLYTTPGTRALGRPKQTIFKPWENRETMNAMMIRRGLKCLWDWLS